MTRFDRLQGFWNKSLLAEAKVSSTVILHLRHPKLVFFVFSPILVFRIAIIRQDEIEYAKNDFGH